MILPNMFNELLQRYLEGRINSVEMDQLNELLRRDPATRHRFIEAMNLDSGLSALVAGVDFSRPGLGPRQLQHRARTLAGWLVVASLCFVLVLGGMSWRAVSPWPYATVQSATGVSEMAGLTHLKGDWHEITRGTLELVTVRGAHVVIEAPARFRFESAQRLRLVTGRLAADVPPSAKKFTVVTPTGNVVDLGTKFGVDVSQHGESEIHVFQGEVIAQSSSGGTRQNLYDGDAFRLQAGVGAVRELRSAAFIRPDEVGALHAALKAGQPSRSNAALEKLRADPDLIALLDFESEENNPGIYNMVQGRWPGSRAPEFMNVGDHMKLDVGADHEWHQLTLAVWVRLDRFGEPFQSLLHTDGWSSPALVGQVHWMVTNNRTMRLALFGNQIAPGQTGDRTYSDSLTPIPSEEHRWIHLATVYDCDQKTARFYLDGVLNNVAPQTIAYPARLGPAQIGNWNSRDRKLSGRMDELVILGRAISDEEIRALYDAGNPYR